MRSVLLFVLLIGIALNSPCTETVPTNADDCLKNYNENSICCLRSTLSAGEEEEKRVCEEMDVSYSGKTEYEETIFKGVKTKNKLNCNIKIDLCGPITARKAKECLSAKLENGVCCFDKNQKVCFSYPFHFESETMDCKSKPEEVKEEEKKWKWPWQKKDKKE